ncbi:MAG: glycosyltransferase family 4 protein [Candidatus Saccharibacteria bacterium]|nr:glycosyltransferase family 4 protein [Candidatus Saccharibacteria bacterium]
MGKGSLANRKKIGIFTGYYPPHLGGVERYTDKLSGALEKLGYNIVIVTSNSNDLINHEKIGNRSLYRLPIHKLAKDRYPMPKTNAEYKELISQVKNEKIDYYIVNTRFHLTSFVGAKIGKGLGRPVMLIEHGTNHFTVNNRWLDYIGLVYEHLLTYRLKHYVDRFYGVSKKCNVWLEHFSIHASGVFYNAVDTADKKIANDYYVDKYSGNEVVITYAGRLIKEKGIMNLLEAFVEIKKKNPKLRMKMVIAGDGALLETIKRNHNDSSIDILGKLDFEHVISLLKRTDIFVHPSLYPEGLPTSILEAGLMGCAVIATPRGGTEEVIIDERHGIIVDGSTESLQKAIQELIVDSRMRKELADKLRHRTEETFNWDVVAKEVDREINSLTME